MNKYRISVIVPVYNMERYLRKCVDSLLNQEGGAFWEIILVNDGSCDTSGQLCDELADVYEQIKVIHKQNGGLSSARNAGIETATGDYVLFVDSDDYVEEVMLNILQKSLEKKEKIDVITFDGVEVGVKGQKAMRGISSLSGCCVSGKTYLLEHYKNRNMCVEAWLYMYRRSFLNKHGLRFREGILHEDVEFTPRAILAANCVMEIPDQLYHYVTRENSISTAHNKEKNIRDLFQTLDELNEFAEHQDPELRRWMKNAVLDSYLNMIYDARMYRAEYCEFVDKNFLRGKAATSYNQVRAELCRLNVWLYCKVNDIFKKIKTTTGYERKVK